jgi:hypothetical protein
VSKEAQRLATKDIQGIRFVGELIRRFAAG